MYNRSPAVTFKRQSLEKWMDIFATNDWQKSFSRSDIREGIDFLDKHTIKEIEIRPDDVIVRYLGNNKSQFFAVVDLEEGQLSARSSLLDNSKPAVAALLAVDEVILDKQDALFAPETDQDNVADKVISDSSDGESVQAPKSLRLSFYMSGQNLCFKAYWTASGKLVFPDNLSRCSGVISERDRSAVVKLIHLTRKAGFLLFKKSKEYRIANVSMAIDFCRSTLSRWSENFIIQMDDNVQKLRQGTKEVHATFTVREREHRDQVIDCSLKLSNQEFSASQNVAKKLLRSDGSPMFIDGLGAVRMSNREIASARAQQSALNKFNGEIPRYMMYSIFSQTDIPYENSPQIVEWKQSFWAPPKKSFILPKILRSYQREGVLWINHILQHGFHGLIADDMGLGKTLQVLTFISKMSAEQQTIVFCPASVVYVWKSEAEKFFPKLNVQIFSANADLDDPHTHVWVVSYTQMRRHKTAITKKNFQLAVLDEAQFIKNPTTKVFHACTAIRSQWRLALSGTPIENNLMDLWSIFRFLMPGLLGERNQFIDMCKTEDIVEKIKKQIAPFMLRRTKETVARELPQKMEINVPCEMTQLQQTLYKNFIDITLKRYGDERHQFDLKNHRFGILSALTRLRQVACDPGIIPSVNATIEDSGKLMLLRNMLCREFSGAQKKIVIFSQFVTLLQRVKRVIIDNFPTVDCFEIIGATKNRNVVVDEFQNIANHAVMLVSLKAGGTGITLTAAELVFLMDPWWNPATERQAIDRVHRIGQEKNVTVYRFITQNSIESGIQRLQERKSSLFSDVIDSIQSPKRNTEFFLEHIQELLQPEEV
ncbi:MAG: DEAD/DEAH box helicase [Puniceicoccales bacterium]|jgi:SNF2 family DNA or RNA helicase|nr:DEAD/DEAH box helicase [Puniceicoccales bacterium]